jgi:hypothetical protein
MAKAKTVYVLGAGASKSASLPLQAELLYQIFTLYPETVENSSGFMQLSINQEEQQVLKYYEEFDKHRQNLADFIINNFSSQIGKEEFAAIKILEETKPSSDNQSFDNWKRAYLIASEVSVSLEDLFTLFDKIILGHEHFRIYKQEQIENIHAALRKCIIFLLSYKSSKIKEIKSYHSYREFAYLLFNTRLNSSYREDILSVITMNWDAILEKEIYKLCKDYNKGKTKKIYPDLCFYDYKFDSSEKRIISTHIKAKGHKNIKILKLHGSINWLVCPYCGRVYVDYEADVAVYELENDYPCPHCKEEFGDFAPQMHSILITPTFLKDINTLNLKNIWHNALIDLTEATKIIFIGYSFPDADFEMRCLLKKAVRPKTAIEVILHNTDNPLEYKSQLEKYNITSDETNYIVNRLNLPERRYNAFFNKDMINFSYNGLEGYIKKEMSK